MNIKVLLGYLLIVLTIHQFIWPSATTVPLVSLSAYNPASNIKKGLRSGIKTIKLKNVAGQDLEVIRKHIIDDLLEPPVNENKIRQLVRSIQPDGSWPGINYKDTSKTGFQHSEHLENMFELSRAYKKPGYGSYKNEDVKRTVSSALDFWMKHDFICENWWWNEMGTPNLMINTLLVLDEDLTERQRTEGARIAGRANLEGFGARPGGDLIQLAGMLGKQGLFKRDEALLEKVIRVMASEIKVTTGRGLQPDMSFHHRTDNVISIHTYGTGYANAFSYWAVKISGTKYKFPEEALKLLIDFYIDGISRAMAFGKYPDLGARNRDLSRWGILAPADAEIAENLLKASNYRKAELEDLVKIRKGEKQPNLTWDRFFWHSEYFTHQRLHWFSSVRMHSSRQNNMEEPYNEEGLKNHHFADGSNFISVTGKEYFDIFPVWDWQKIPGTTIVQKPALPHWKQITKKGLGTFVGGVTNGIYGASAIDFISPHDPLKARKSWFFFDREFVCLGSAITSEAAYPVNTTLNQCLLNDKVVIKANKEHTQLKTGVHQLKDVSWIAHHGVAYIFPSTADAHLNNSPATGNWRQINHHPWATEEPVQKDVFTLWLDHGTKPQNASYAYIVVPGMDASSIDNYNKRSEITILANTPETQAVQHKGLNRTMIVFYQPGKIKVSNELTITAGDQCMVMLQTSGKTISELVVSDPTRILRTIQLSVNTQIETKGLNWQSSWNKKMKTSVIKIDLPTDEALAGTSVVLQLHDQK